MRASSRRSGAGRPASIRRATAPRVILILRGRRVGFSLAELREILDLYDGTMTAA